MSFLQWLGQQITVDIERSRLDLHCAHQPLGSCGTRDCSEQVEADYWN